MKDVFSATFLIILVTLECRGQSSSWSREGVSGQVRNNTRWTQVSNSQVLRQQQPQPQSSPTDNRGSQNGQQQGGSFSPTGTQAPEDNSVDSAKAINDQLRQFGLNLLIQLSELDPTSNLVMSPFSVWVVLLMILEGARGNTAAQIRNVLHLPEDPRKIRSNFKFIESGLMAASSSAEFISVNGLFYDKNRPISEDFRLTAQLAYHAELHDLDFSKPAMSVRQVNAWVANKTQNRITRLIHLADVSRPELLVANAIFFKGLWDTPFNTSATAIDKFYNEQNVHIANVPMMYQKGIYLYSFITEINAHVLDMPYQGNKFRMLIVLPQVGNNLLNVYRAMKSFPVNECYKRLIAEQVMYTENMLPVYLPKFRIKNDLTINVLLENLGIKDVFLPDIANLTGISRNQIYLNRMIHISEIEVNEQGATASSVTGGTFVNKIIPPKFMANRPFAYFIVEDSRKTVIFAGRVMNPNK